jgi:hypothetical protein
MAEILGPRILFRSEAVRRRCIQCGREPLAMNALREGIHSRPCRVAGVFPDYPLRRCRIRGLLAGNVVG